MIFTLEYLNLTVNDRCMIICPKCGAKSTEKQFAGAFCINCHEFKFKLPKRVRIKQCKKCEKVWMGFEWAVYNQKKIEGYIGSKFRGDFERIDYYLDSETAVMYFKVEGKVHMVDKKFKPEFEIVNCKECSKRSGGYYEAIIQLRGNKKQIQKWASKLIYILGKKTFVTKVEERKEGIDLFIGNSRAVFELFRELGFKAKISRKLFTQRKGKRMYRTTFAIRF